MLILPHDSQLLSYSLAFSLLRYMWDFHILKVKTATFSFTDKQYFKLNFT